MLIHRDLRDKKGISISNSAIIINNQTTSTATGLGFLYNRLYIATTTNNGIIGNTDGIAINTSTSHTWAASTTFDNTGTTTIRKLAVNNSNTNINGLNVNWPSAQGASSTVLKNNGSGSMVWDPEGWQELISTSTPIATSTFNISGLPAVKELKIILNIVSSGGGQNELTFNGDNGSNYGYRSTVTNGTGGQNAKATTFYEAAVSTSTGGYYVIQITNEASRHKRIIMSGAASFSGSDPGVNVTSNGVWDNTAAQITSMRFRQTLSNTMAAGSSVRIYGSKD